jgi:hypothetical protein
MAFVFPGGKGNTHAAAMAADSLVLEYTRNVNKFKYNRWVQLSPVDYTQSLWVEMDQYACSRVLANGASLVWPDGQRAPKGEALQFKFHSVMTERRNVPFTLGGKAIDEADWDILASQNRTNAQVAMTERTNRAVSLITTAANYGSNTADVVSNLEYGQWVGSGPTSTTPYIQQSILYGVKAIALATNAVVQISDIKLVISPSLAIGMATTDEIRNYVKNTPDSLRLLENGFPGEFGMPAKLYGVEVVIEDAVLTNTKVGSATQNQLFCMPPTCAALIGRIGGLMDGRTGQPTYSAVTDFVREEFTVFEEYSAKDRLTDGYVAYDDEVVMTAPAAGFLFTNVSDLTS